MSTKQSIPDQFNTDDLVCIASKHINMKTAYKHEHTHNPTHIHTSNIYTIHIINRVGGKYRKRKEKGERRNKWLINKHRKDIEGREIDDFFSRVRTQFTSILLSYHREKNKRTNTHGPSLDNREDKLTFSIEDGNVICGQASLCFYANQQGGAASRCNTFSGEIFWFHGNSKSTFL